MLGFLRRLRARLSQPRPRAFRYERFGGIAQLGGRIGVPQGLVFVDRERAADLGHGTPPAGLWDDPSGDGRLEQLLVAPLEAHLQLTNRCGAGCAGCYTGATPAGAPGEWGLSEWVQALDELAAAGVFHVALGGGESAELPWLGELCDEARRRGIVPNLTTSGLYDEAVLQRLCGWARAGRFGQINVSLDGVGATYAAVRGFDGFHRADRALAALRRAWPDVGINCVVTRRSFDDLEALFAHARRRRCNEVELLRFKPAGRGARGDTYPALRCSDEQHRQLLPTALGLSRRHRVRVRLDCSFTPMVAHHRPPPELVRFLAIYGCAGGDLLIAARAGGQLSPCSFAPTVSTRITGLREYWRGADAFPPFRGYAEASEPCRSCDYLAMCRGGCRIVSAHVAGDPRAPDPECPRVLAAAASSASAPAPEAAGPPDSVSPRRRLRVIA